MAPLKAKTLPEGKKLNDAIVTMLDANSGHDLIIRDRWIVDSKIKKLKTLHSKKHRTSLITSAINSSVTVAKADPMDDSTTHDETNHSATGGKKKDEATETEEHVEEAEEDSGAEADDNADQGDEVLSLIHI